MARVPSVTLPTTTTPSPRALDIDAGALDVDAALPDDFDWDDLPSDEGEKEGTENHQHDPLEGVQQHPPNGHHPAPPNAARAPSPPPRTDGVVADPMGVDVMEDGEIDDHKRKKWKKKKRKGAGEILHCDVCDITVTSRVTMDSHLQGQRHMAKARQAALEGRNKQLTDHGKAIVSEPQPREHRKPQDEWHSKNSPPRHPPTAQPAPTPSADHRNMARPDVRPGRDPYATIEQDRRPQPPRDDRDSAPRDQPPSAPNDRDRRPEPSRDDRDSTARDARLANQPAQLQNADRDRRPEPPRDERDSTARDPRAASGDPRPSGQTSQPQTKEGSEKGKNTEMRPGRDPYAVSKPQEPNDQRSLGNSSLNQNGTPSVSEDAKKRKRSDGGAETVSGQSDERASNGDREPPRGYETTGDGALRRKLSDGKRDHVQRDSGYDPSRQPGPGPSRPSPPVLVSEPGPPRPPPPALVSEPAPADNRDDRRTADQPRRFTYGSVRRDTDDPSNLIPYEWLKQPMTTNDWKDLRHHTFSKGDGIDQLAFKMLQEILLSPVLGVSSSSLAPYSRAMLKAMKNQYLTPEGEAYAKFEDFPKELVERDENFSRADPEWQKTQTPEQMALRLVGDNISFCLHTYEDADAMRNSEPHDFPKRGSFGAKNTTKNSRDGGGPRRYKDSVELDPLFNQLFEHLIRKGYNM